MVSVRPRIIVAISFVKLERAYTLGTNCADVSLTKIVAGTIAPKVVVWDQYWASVCVSSMNGAPNTPR